MIQITAQVGDPLRWEEDGAHGSDEEDLGLHQEKQATGLVERFDIEPYSDFSAK